MTKRDKVQNICAKYLIAQQKNPSLGFIYQMTEEMMQLISALESKAKSAGMMKVKGGKNGKR